MRETTEPGDTRAVARTIAVIVLMLLSLVALRGHLPGAEPRPEPEELTRGGSGSLAAVVVMLVVSVVVIAAAILSQALRRSAAPGPGEPVRELRGDRGPVPWRSLLIVGAVALTWVLVILLLMRWASPVDQPGDAALPDGGAGPAPEAADAAGATDTGPAQRPGAGGDTLFGILAGTTIALLALSIAATVVGRRRIPAPATAAATPSGRTAPASAAPDLARAAELGLAEMDDLDRDPREAIIACYLAMERELEKSPGSVPQASDTPAEVLARAVAHHVLPAGSATELVDLFEEARFSPHVMNEGHRTAAISALRSVQRVLVATP